MASAANPAHTETMPCRYDEHVHAKHAIGDPSKRAFTYFVLTGGRFIYASALRVAVLKFILSMTVRKLRRHRDVHVNLGKHTAAKQS